MWRCRLIYSTWCFHSRLWSTAVWVAMVIRWLHSATQKPWLRCGVLCVRVVSSFSVCRPSLITAAVDDSVGLCGMHTVSTATCDYNTSLPTGKCSTKSTCVMHCRTSSTSYENFSRHDAGRFNIETAVGLTHKKALPSCASFTSFVIMSTLFRLLPADIIVKDIQKWMITRNKQHSIGNA